MSAFHVPDNQTVSWSVYWPTGQSESTRALIESLILAEGRPAPLTLAEAAKGWANV